MRRARARRNPGDFYQILGVARTATPDEIKAAYRRCAKTFHPDLNKDPAAVERFEDCAQAYDTLSDPEKRASYDQFGAAGPGGFGRVRHGPPSGKQRSKIIIRRPAPETIPPWQPDKRSFNNRVNEAAGFTDKNFCLRAIYDESLRLGGELLLVTLTCFDGFFSRATLQAFCSEPALGFAGKVVEAWNSSGANPYATKAVFAVFAGFPGRALLVRLLGDDVANVADGMWIEFGGPNQNPWNDPAFTRMAVTLVQLAEERAEQLTQAAVAAARGRRPSRRPGPAGVEFFCPECARRLVVEHGVLPDACPFCDLDLRQFRHWPTDVASVEPGFGRLRRRNEVLGHRRRMTTGDLIMRIHGKLDTAWHYIDAGNKLEAAELAVDAVLLMDSAVAAGVDLPDDLYDEVANVGWVVSEPSKRRR